MPSTRKRNEARDVGAVATAEDVMGLALVRGDVQLCILHRLEVQEQNDQTFRRRPHHRRSGEAHRRQDPDDTLLRNDRFGAGAGPHGRQPEALRRARRRFIRHDGDVGFEIHQILDLLSLAAHPERPAVMPMPSRVVTWSRSNNASPYRSRCAAN